jgi:Domain of unknown function (DUF4411)
VTFYSFDTSSLLNGRRNLLPPGTFVTLWSSIESMITNGDIRCVDEVRNELARRDDAIHDWAKSQPDLFVPLTGDVQLAAREVLAAHPRLVGVGGGRNSADPFVIALARSQSGVVVTEETLSGNISKPRIPDVCDAMGVPWLNLVRFVQQQGWTF